MADWTETAGGKALRKWVTGGEGRSFKGLAEALGVSYQTVYDWRRGEQTPTDAHRALIQALTGVEPSLWTTAKQRKAARNLQARIANARKMGAASKGRKANLRSGAS